MSSSDALPDASSAPDIDNDNSNGNAKDYETTLPEAVLDLAALEREFEETQARLKRELESEKEKSSQLEQRASKVDLLEIKAARLQYALADEQMKVIDLQKEHAKLNEDYLKQYLRMESAGVIDEEQSSDGKEMEETARVSELEENVSKLQYELADERMKNIKLERRITAQFGGVDRLFSGEFDLEEFVDANKSGTASAKGDSASLEERRLQYELADERMRVMELEREKDRVTLRADQLQFELADMQLESMRDTTGRKNEIDRLKYELADERMKVIETSRRASRQEQTAKQLQYELADERMNLLELEREQDVSPSSSSSKGKRGKKRLIHHIGSDDEDDETLRMRKLEYALADEQMHVIELQRERRMSHELFEKAQKERDMLNAQLSEQRMKTLEVDKERRDSVKEVYVWRQQAEQLEENLHEAQDELEEAKLKTREVENQRRASISSLSQKMWNKLIEKQTEHDEESIHLAKRLQMVEEENARLRKSKMALILSTSRVIDDLRSNVLLLSNRLRRYEEREAQAQVQRRSNGKPR